MKQQAAINWAQVRARLQASERAVQRAMHPDENAIQETLEQRARHLANRHSDQTEREDALSLLVFRIGGERFAMELESVAEVGRLGRCTAVPGGPSELCGVISHHGEVRSVIDLGRLIGRTCESPTNHGFFVLLRDHHREVRLRVDELAQVLEIPTEDISSTLELDVGLLRKLSSGLTRDGILILRSDALSSEIDATAAEPDVRQVASPVNGNSATEKDMLCA